MAQITVRVDDELLVKLKTAASTAGKSVNAWVTTVLTAAADPEHQSDEVERIRERLRLAGLLLETDRRVRAPSREVVKKARAAAGRGKDLSAIVSEGRR